MDYTETKEESWRTTIHGRKTTKIIVSREMAVNDLVCKDINAGRLDLLMPSVMKKTGRHKGAWLKRCWQ